MHDPRTVTPFSTRIDDADGYQYIRFRIELDFAGGVRLSSWPRVTIEEFTIPIVVFD